MGKSFKTFYKENCSFKYSYIKISSDLEIGKISKNEIKWKNEINYKLVRENCI